ncbi:MAG: hypothetical protein K8S23_14690 [Candidatus Cloacimonetes bacterium]|nr:hypothetical protein [Candidatus Cloacimonadota bacterium]
MKNIFHEIAKSSFFARFLRYSLWLTNGYLLYIEVVFVTEKYKRYYPKDIKAIQYKKNSRFFIWNIVWGSILFLFGIFILITLHSNAIIFWIIMFLLISIKLIHHLSLGKTCDFYIITEVSTEKIKAISHFRKVEKFIKLIVPLIFDAQKELKIISKEDSTKPISEEIQEIDETEDIEPKNEPVLDREYIANLLDNEIISREETVLSEASISSEISSKTFIMPDLPKSTLQISNGKWHFILFIVIIFHGIFLYIPELVDNPFIMSLTFVFNFIGMILASIVVFKQFRKQISNSARKHVVSYLVISGILLFIYYILASVYSVTAIDETFGYSINSGIFHIIKSGVKELPFIRYTNLLFGSVFSFLGISGFLLLSKER